MLPVVFTLITEEEAGAEASGKLKLRERVEMELMQIGTELSVTIAIVEVERFGE